MGVDVSEDDPTIILGLIPNQHRYPPLSFQLNFGTPNSLPPVPPPLIVRIVTNLKILKITTVPSLKKRKLPLYLLKSKVCEGKSTLL